MASSKERIEGDFSRISWFRKPLASVLVLSIALAGSMNCTTSNSPNDQNDSETVAEATNIAARISASTAASTLETTRLQLEAAYQLTATPGVTAAGRAAVTAAKATESAAMTSRLARASFGPVAIFAGITALVVQAELYKGANEIADAATKAAFWIHARTMTAALVEMQAKFLQAKGKLTKGDVQDLRDHLLGTPFDDTDIPADGWNSRTDANSMNDVVRSRAFEIYQTTENINLVVEYILNRYYLDVRIVNGPADKKPGPVAARKFLSALTGLNEADQEALEMSSLIDSLSPTLPMVPIGDESDMAGLVKQLASTAGTVVSDATMKSYTTQALASLKSANSVDDPFPGNPDRAAPGDGASIEFSVKTGGRRATLPSDEPATNDGDGTNNGGVFSKITGGGGGAGGTPNNGPNNGNGSGPGGNRIWNVYGLLATGTLVFSIGAGFWNFVLPLIQKANEKPTLTPEQKKLVQASVETAKEQAKKSAKDISNITTKCAVEKAGAPVKDIRQCVAERFSQFIIERTILTQLGNTLGEGKDRPTKDTMAFVQKVLADAIYSALPEARNLLLAGNDSRWYVNSVACANAVFALTSYPKDPKDPKKSLVTPEQVQAAQIIATSAIQEQQQKLTLKWVPYGDGVLPVGTEPSFPNIERLGTCVKGGEAQAAVDAAVADGSAGSGGSASSETPPQKKP